MHEYERRNPSYEGTQYDWADAFADNLRGRLRGRNLEELAKPKPNVAETAFNFAGEYLPPDALEVAKIAHIAELTHHHNLGQNIRRSFTATFGEGLEEVNPASWHLDSEHMPLRYTFGLMRDFPIIADFTKEHEAKCQALGLEYVDIEGLVDLVERTNFESIIIKSALDYSNFQLLNSKDYLSDKEKAKMRRIITAIKTVDSPLLALTGFDALEAEILSKAYTWELEQTGNDYFVSRSRAIFDELGGRQELGHTAETFLEDLFANDTYTHSRVTTRQDNYNMFFSDGFVRFDGDGSEHRVLARLKSVGATAKKIHSLYNKTEMLETPMDIIGITLISQDEASMADCLQSLMERLSGAPVAYQAAPSRTEQVHIKGRPGFMARFGSNGEHSDLYRNLSIQDEPCDNGYEAVKLTLMFSHNGVKIPVEIQVTHETARSESRSGLGSHTLFKLMKLAKDAGDASIRGFSDEELLERFQRICSRKQKFDRLSYETNGESTTRANGVYREIQYLHRSLGNVASK